MSLFAAIAQSLDPQMFAAACGIDALDPWQHRLLTQRPRRSILCAARQTGKSTAVALMCLETAVNEEKALIILAAPSARQSSELLRRIRDYYRSLAEHGSAPELAVEHVSKLEWRNGSRIVAIPGDGEGRTVRGLANARLIVFDEAGYCDDGLYAAVRPMTAVNKNAQTVLLSTPNGRRGFYFEIWENGDPSWERIKVRAEDCGRISEQFLQEERRELGEHRFAQEYMLQFVDNQTCAFSSAIIDRAFTHEVRPLWA